MSTEAKKAAKANTNKIQVLMASEIGHGMNKGRYRHQALNKGHVHSFINVGFDQKYPVTIKKEKTSRDMSVALYEENKGSIVINDKAVRFDKHELKLAKTLKAIMIEGNGRLQAAHARLALTGEDTPFYCHIADDSLSNEEIKLGNNTQAIFTPLNRFDHFAEVLEAVKQGRVIGRNDAARILNKSIGNVREVFNLAALAAMDEQLESELLGDGLPVFDAEATAEAQAAYTSKMEQADDAISKADDDATREMLERLKEDTPTPQDVHKYITLNSLDSTASNKLTANKLGEKDAEGKAQDLPLSELSYEQIKVILLANSSHKPAKVKPCSTADLKRLAANSIKRSSKGGEVLALILAGDEVALTSYLKSL